jgi:hypothetical protein
MFGSGAMTNAKRNAAFLAVADSKVCNEILTAIGNHYGISASDAKAEVLDEDAEHLCDYLTGSIRTATYVAMSRLSLFR